MALFLSVVLIGTMGGTTTFAANIKPSAAIKKMKTKSEEIDNLFDFVKSQGINTVSVKVAVYPDEKNEKTACYTLSNAIKTIRQAKKSGLKTNIVLFY